ncbi:MAG: DUF5706 domain-containing protein [Bacteroidota bacterium]|nr:DUF5706 domain-containing protein [Bacteroidota bacterium]
MNETDHRSKSAERGRETLFRVSYQHQSKLIQIADYKANMIISLSTMIISGIIAVIGYGAVSGKIGNFNLMLFIPVVGIVIACLVSLIYAIQAARPKLLMTPDSSDTSNRSSLLFFGVISQYNQKEYIEKMKSLLSSDSEMYEHMTIDLHNQGLILKRKYNLLVYSYQVLKYGFVINVVLFIALLMMNF